MTVRVLFVCLGNICRSPMAEGVFTDLVQRAGLADQIDIDSAGTSSWHVGEKAHRGTRRAMSDHGISYDGRSRQIDNSDLTSHWNYIIGMDQANMRELRRFFGDLPGLYRLLDFAAETEDRDVPDPYYNGKFEAVYQLVKDGSSGLLAAIREQEGI
jgi:protein-tyrosine phosphatase